MFSFLISLLLGIIALQLVLNLALFIWKVLTPFGRMYYYEADGKVSYFGHIRKNPDGKYIIIDAGKSIATKEIGEVVVSGDKAWIRLVRDSDSGGSTSFTDLGYVNRNGEIFDSNNVLIAKCDANGKRVMRDLWLMHSTEVIMLDANGNETEFKVGRCTEGLRFGDKKSTEITLLSRAAAALTLFEDYIIVEEETRSLPGTGWKDLAFPASLIYVFFYSGIWKVMQHYNMFPALGDFSFLAGMMIVYFMLWWTLHIIKTDLANRNNSFVALLNMLNRNTGLGTWNFILVILTVMGLLKSIFINGNHFIPLFAVLLIGTGINLLSFTSAKWKVNNASSTLWLPKKFKTKREKVKALRPGGGGASAINTITKEFIWRLDDFGVDQSQIEKFSVTFIEDELKGSNPPTRERNPFFGKDPVSGKDKWEIAVLNLEQSIKDVLKGSDHPSMPLTIEENAVDTIIQSASDICSKYNFADFELLNLLLSFCQNQINYKLDANSNSILNAHEYVRFPVESLYDREGDCDCTAALAYKIFERLGIEVKFAILNESNGAGRHAAVLIKKNNNRVSLPPNYTISLPAHPEYAYCEATGSGWRIGSVPSGYDLNSIIVI